jgi:hypothetical protein
MSRESDNSVFPNIPALGGEQSIQWNTIIEVSTTFRLTFLS